MVPWPRIVALAVAYVVIGIALPIAVLGWLGMHHQPPYVLDAAVMASPRTALGGHPVTVRPATGVFDIVADGGTTAVYADGATATIVHASRPNQVIDKYGSSLNERASSSFSVGGVTVRDATLTDGRLARTFGLDETVFAFTASTPAALDRLVSQSAVRRNDKRDIGNTVLDGHIVATVLIFMGWLLLSSVLAAVAIIRAVVSGAQTPAPSAS